MHIQIIDDDNINDGDKAASDEIHNRSTPPKGKGRVFSVRRKDNGISGPRVIAISKHH